MNDPNKHTSMGQAILAWREANDQLEALYEASHGEVTDVTQDAEAWAQLNEVEMLKRLARYGRSLDRGMEECDAEVEMFRALRDERERKRKWVTSMIVDVLGDRKSMNVGAHKIDTRMSHAVGIDEGLDLDKLAADHPDLVRWTEAKASAPALDKSACKAADKAGRELPIGIWITDNRSVTIK